MPSEAIGIGLMHDKLKCEQRDSISHPIALLIARAQSGDADAFDQLMICNERRVVAIAWRLLGNRDDARDAAQETFLRVYRHLHKFDLERDFGGWLYRIAVNVCRDQARKRKTVTSLEDETEAAGLATEDGLENRILQSQQRALVIKALSSLSQKERAAVVLRDLEGLATEEVARILGSTPTTIRSQISSARVKIKNFRDRYLKNGRKER